MKRGPHGILTKKSLEELIQPDNNCEECLGNGFLWDGQICSCCKEFWQEWVATGDNKVTMVIEWDVKNESKK